MTGTLLFAISTFRLEKVSPRKPSPLLCRTARCCTTVPQALTPEGIDKLFKRLSHVNKNLRKKASLEIAEIATDDTIARLIAMLSLEDTDNRRAAVQALGMTGMAAVPAVLHEMRESSNSTVRASCSKALAAVVLYFPEQRAAFPSEALDLLEESLHKDPDPVTKLATVGCLGTMGSDLAMDNDEVLAGCERAVEILLALCGKTGDMAVGATAVGAVAQIGQNGRLELKQRIAQELQRLCDKELDSDEEESGFGYIKEMARGHLDTLVGGPKVADAE